MWFWINRIFVKKGFFCRNLPNFDQNFQNLSSSKFLWWFYSWSASFGQFWCFQHQYWRFYRQIKWKKHQKLPLYFLYKSQDPENWISHIFGTKLNFNIPQKVLKSQQWVLQNKLDMFLQPSTFLQPFSGSWNSIFRLSFVNSIFWEKIWKCMYEG